MTMSTLEKLVGITQNLGQYSEPWRNIASYSTDDQAWSWLPTSRAIAVSRRPEIVEEALEGKAQIERGESVKLTLNELRTEIESAGAEQRPLH